MLSRLLVGMLITRLFVGGCTDNVNYACAVIVGVAQADCSPVPGVVLTLTDGDYSEEMVPSYPGPEPITFGGAIGRPSVYILTIEAEGFETKTIPIALHVDCDGICAVQTGHTTDGYCGEPSIWTVFLAPTE